MMPGAMRTRREQLWWQVAENRLSSSLLTAKLLSLRDFPEESYKYQPPRGSMRLRAALVSYLQHTFMKVLNRECRLDAISESS